MQNQRTSTMSTPNPLMPQGALQRPSSTTRSRTVTAISVIVTLHVVVIVGVLMGCNRDKSVDYSAMSSPETLPKNEDSYHSEAFPPLTSDGAAGESAGTAGAAASTPVAAPAKTIVQGPPPASPRATPASTTGQRKTGVVAIPGAPDGAGSVMPPVEIPSMSRPVSTVAAPPPAETGTTKYAIRRGDTFSGIASRHGVSLDALLRVNPTSDPKRLQIGKSINIPSSATRPRAAAPATAAAAAGGGGAVARIYEVQPGDSLTAIAKKTGTTISGIKRANNLRSDRIKIGDKLKIPAQ